MVKAIVDKRIEEKAVVRGDVGTQPNEFDRYRVVRLLRQRVRYRYVEPEVQAVNGGYQIVSPCCSRNIHADGGIIDIARLEYALEENVWRAYCKNHALNQWKLYSEAPMLQDLLIQINEDPSRVFWP
jgi:hypothetical protein